MLLSLQVKVRTSDIKGAGTDSKVSLVLFGYKEGMAVDSGSHKLDNSANNFERGQIDQFVIKCKDLGELTRVMVR